MRFAVAGETQVAISSVEIVSFRDIPEPSSSSSAAAAAPPPRDESTAENSYTLGSEASGEIQLPAQSPAMTAVAGEQTDSTSEEGRTSGKQSEPPPRRGFLSWRKKRRKTSDGGAGRGGGCSSSSPGDKVRSQPRMFIQFHWKSPIMAKIHSSKGFFSAGMGREGADQQGWEDEAKNRDLLRLHRPARRHRRR